MAISFGSGFNVRAKEPIDTRLILSKAEMFYERYASDGSVIPIPDNYLCICKEDNRVYTYNSNNAVTADTGKFRPADGFVDSMVEINSTTYKYITRDSYPIQVESAITDGAGNNIQSALASKQGLITSNDKLNSDYVTDTNSVNKFVTAEEKQTWNNKQASLVAGRGLSIQSGSNVIDCVFVGGEGISIDQSVISSTIHLYEHNLTITWKDPHQIFGANVFVFKILNASNTAYNFERLNSYFSALNPNVRIPASGLFKTSDVSDIYLALQINVSESTSTSFTCLGVSLTNPQEYSNMTINSTTATLSDYIIQIY